MKRRIPTSRHGLLHLQHRFVPLLLCSLQLVSGNRASCTARFIVCAKHPMCFFFILSTAPTMLAALSETIATTFPSSFHSLITDFSSIARLSDVWRTSVSRFRRRRSGTLQPCKSCYCEKSTRRSSGKPRLSFPGLL